MRAAAYETILPSAPIATLPLTLKATASRVSPFLIVLLALPAAFATLTPFWLIFQHSDPGLLLTRFETSVPLGLTFLAWTALFGWPIVRRTMRIGQSRSISISHGRVRVEDLGLTGRSKWNEPLAAYSGIAHHVRSSLSGTRHELLLIHPDPARSLLLRAASSISQEEIDALTHLLGCREIAPRVFYRKPEPQSQPIAVREPQFATAQ